MYLDKLKIKNFRKYGDQGIEVEFNKDFNLLVGENDSGKSSIIDAIRKVLWTYSYEKDRLEEEDFYNKETDREIKIECIFKGLDDPEEAHHFIEWLGIDDEKKRFLNIWYIGKYNRDTDSYYGETKAGPDEEGVRMDAKALEYLRVSYLKPLRDAEDELEAKKYSRLSKILYSHEIFKYDKLEDEQKSEIYKFIKSANEKIEKYFRETEDCDGNCVGCPLERKKRCGKRILDQVNEYLDSFSTKQEILKSGIGVVKDLRLKQILEKLDLKLGAPKPGLGALNRLFIAAEFLLLQRKEYYGVKLGLIEEIEAHLHPQSQLLLIEYLQKIAENEGIQLILTTHSPNLASKVELKNIILLKENTAYPLGSDHTNLEKGDYRFLQRFLDVTRANMFFANGIIFVEGDAENILIPTIADLIGKNLSEYGVSIVNVGSTAFLRYSGIYQCKTEKTSEKKTIGIPVSIITDVDEKPIKKDNGQRVEPQNLQTRRKEKKNNYKYVEIEAFVSEYWTLEYCLARSGLWEDFYRAVKYAEKEKNSNKYCLTKEKKKEVEKALENYKKEVENKNGGTISETERAYKIYNDIMLEKTISKAITAQYFSEILIEKKKNGWDPVKLKKDPNLSYLIKAIEHVTHGK